MSYNFLIYMTQLFTGTRKMRRGVCSRMTPELVEDLAAVLAEQPASKRPARAFLWVEDNLQNDQDNDDVLALTKASIMAVEVPGDLTELSVQWISDSLCAWLRGDGKTPPLRPAESKAVEEDPARTVVGPAVTHTFPVAPPAFVCPNDCAKLDGAHLYEVESDGKCVIVFEKGKVSPKLGVLPKVLPPTNGVGNFLRSFWQNDKARCTELPSSECKLCQPCQEHVWELFPHHVARLCDDNYIAKSVLSSSGTPFVGIGVLGRIGSGFVNALRLHDPSNKTVAGARLAFGGFASALANMGAPVDVPGVAETLAALSVAFQAADAQSVPFLRVVCRAIAFTARDLLADDDAGTARQEVELVAVALGTQTPFWEGVLSRQVKDDVASLAAAYGDHVAATATLPDGSKVSRLPFSGMRTKAAFWRLSGEPHISQMAGTNMVGRTLQGACLVGAGVAANCVASPIATSVAVSQAVTREVVMPSVGLLASVAFGALVAPPMLLAKLTLAGDAEDDADDPFLTRVKKRLAAGFQACFK